MSEKKKIATVESVTVALDRMAPQFAVTLPAHIPVERFKRVVSTAVQSSPELLDADRKSLFLACQQAAQDGLLPDGKEGALVIFNSKDKQTDTWKKTVKWMPMVRGILIKLRQSGQVMSPHVDVVFENDEFKFWVDESGPHVLHNMVAFGDRGDPIGGYAMARLSTGELVVERMSKAEIMAVRGVSKSKDSGPWSGPFTLEMWKKTVLRRLAKRLPMSAEEQTVVERDDDLYDLTPKPLPAPETARPARQIEAQGQKEAGVELITSEGETVSCANPAAFLKAWAAACAAAGAITVLDGLWESNSPGFANLPDDLAQNARDIWDEAAKAVEQPKTKPAPKAAKAKAAPKSPPPEPEQSEETYDDPV